jgi:hypothetical protein
VFEFLGQNADGFVTLACLAIESFVLNQQDRSLLLGCSQSLLQIIDTLCHERRNS